MIGTRFAAAVGLVLAIVAIALGVSAVMGMMRDDDGGGGRMVQTRLTNTYTGDPVLFPLDDFVVVRGSDARLHAWYVYPPGYSGHTRGCALVWSADATVQTVQGTRGPGLFIDPCSGDRFDRDGHLLGSSAEGDLDYFDTGPGLDGVVVDTRTLYCGARPGLISGPGGTPTATPHGDEREECEPVR